MRGLAGLFAGVCGGDRINLFTVSPNIGKICAFPEQNMFGSKITRAYIDGDPTAALKLILALIWWQLGEFPDKSLLKLLKAEQKDSFDIVAYTKKAWIDGDTVTNPVRGEVTVKRIDKERAFPVVAIVPNFMQEASI